MFYNNAILLINCKMCKGGTKQQFYYSISRYRGDIRSFSTFTNKLKKKNAQKKVVKSSPPPSPAIHFGK